MNKKKLYTILLILGTVFWGIAFPIIKTGVGTLSPYTFLCYRFMLAAFAMAILFSKTLKRINKQSVKTALLLSIPLFFGISFQTLGLKYSPASQCAFITGLCVILVPFLKLILYKQRIQPNLWFASFTAITGLYIISVKDGLNINIGDLYSLISTLGFALYLINVAKRSSVSGSVIPSVVVMFIFCSIFAFIIALIDSQSLWFPSETNFWISILFSAFLSTAYMYSISNKAQQYISEEKVAIIYLFEPIFATMAAFFLINEPLTWRLVVGGILIILSMFVAESTLFSKRFATIQVKSKIVNK